MSEFIKIVYDNKPYTWSISSDGNDIIASRKLTIEEVAELFGVEVEDMRRIIDRNGWKEVR